MALQNERASGQKGSNALVTPTCVLPALANDVSFKPTRVFRSSQLLDDGAKSQVDLMMKASLVVQLIREDTVEKRRNCKNLLKFYLTQVFQSPSLTCPIQICLPLFSQLFTSYPLKQHTLLSSLSLSFSYSLFLSLI